MPLDYRAAHKHLFEVHQCQYPGAAGQPEGHRNEDFDVRHILRRFVFCGQRFLAGLQFIAER